MYKPIIHIPYNNFIEVYGIQSDSFSKLRYTVALNDKGEWSCSCPAWMFNEPRRNCKHIGRLISWKILNPKITLPVNPNCINRFAALDV